MKRKGELERYLFSLLLIAALASLISAWGVTAGVHRGQNFIKDRYDVKQDVVGRCGSTREKSSRVINAENGKRAEGAEAPRFGSKRLDDRHAQHDIPCDLCHGKPAGEDAGSTGQCLKCHVSYERVAALTKSKGVSPNPHDSHYGEIRCTLCHRVHKDSELYCNGCHSFDLKVP
jgi:hypothetical protein